MNEEIERLIKEHRCLFNECGVKLPKNLWKKGLCEKHLACVIAKKRLFPKESVHMSYGERDDFKAAPSGYGYSW